MTLATYVDTVVEVPYLVIRGAVILGGSSGGSSVSVLIVCFLCSLVGVDIVILTHVSCDSSSERVASCLRYPYYKPACNPICRSMKPLIVTETPVLSLAQPLSNPMAHFANEKGYVER